MRLREREKTLRAAVRKWGNSAAVRIPASVLEAARVCLDQPVEMHVESGRIIIAPIQPSRYDINVLVAGISDENRHAPMEIHAPLGEEVW